MADLVGKKSMRIISYSLDRCLNKLVVIVDKTECWLKIESAVALERNVLFFYWKMEYLS